MRSITRRQTPDVRNGRVQKKNNHAPHLGDYYRTTQKEVLLVRERPGEGYRHLLTVEDLRVFLTLIPNWDEISVGLDAVVLTAGEWGFDGWHRPGIVAVCAWERELWTETTPAHVEEHREILDRLGVPRELFTDKKGERWVRCQWTVETARAYQLLHILLHELGHHYDRMTTRRKLRTGRGEPFAESYALEWEAIIWDRFWRHFRIG
ncbi:MAG: hypothetical protein V4671_00290 [Armatimonadota bacterium]